MELRKKQARKETNQLADAIANSCCQPLMTAQHIQGTLAFWTILCHIDYNPIDTMLTLPIQYGEPSDAGNFPDLDASFMVERIGESGLPPIIGMYMRVNQYVVNCFFFLQ